MENDKLNKLWEVQANEIADINSKDLIRKAKKQRNGQYINIGIMSLTVVILIIYAFNYAFSQWNTFNLGLLLMISSLSFRIILEFYSVYRKEMHVVTMDHKSYHAYLKNYYKNRLIINYIITPICIAVYILGFYLLLPYFKSYFSSAFYTYILISGIISILAVITIIIFSTFKEQGFLRQLNKR